MQYGRPKVLRESSRTTRLGGLASKNCRAVTRIANRFHHHSSSSMIATTGSTQPVDFKRRAYLESVRSLVSFDRALSAAATQASLTGGQTVNQTPYKWPSFDCGAIMRRSAEPDSRSAALVAFFCFLHGTRKKNISWEPKKLVASRHCSTSKKLSRPRAPCDSWKAHIRKQALINTYQFD